MDKSGKPSVEVDTVILKVPDSFRISHFSDAIL